MSGKGETMEYELTGKDLPELYKHEQEPIFHQFESWELARGEGWTARVETCGEIRARENGEVISVYDLTMKYDTDEKLHKAEEKGVISFDNNNWYELEFFKDGEKGLEFLDIGSDDCVCFDFEEAIQIFKNYMADEKFCEILRKELA